MKLVGSCLPRNSSRTNQSHRRSMPSFSMLGELLSLQIIIGHSHYWKNLLCCHLLTMVGYGMRDWNPGCLIGAICLKSARHILYWLAAIKNASTESVCSWNFMKCISIWACARYMRWNNIPQQWTVRWLSYACWRTMKYDYYYVCKINPLVKFYPIQKSFCMIFLLKTVTCIMQTQPF